jgi:hypothetical protein
LTGGKVTGSLKFAEVPAFNGTYPGARSSLGLSPVYIWPERVSRPPAGAYRPPLLRVPLGGGMVAIKGPSETAGVLEQGNKVAIMGFSRASRRNLIWKMGQIDREKAGLPLFATLTYGREWPSDGRVVKDQLHAFHKRLARRYAGSCDVWKMELQKRGAPHFHMMLFGVPPRDCVRSSILSRRANWAAGRGLPWLVSREGLSAAMRACGCPVCWVQLNWHEVAGYGSFDQLRAGTRVEQARTWAGVVSYTVKYLGKVVESSVVIRQTGERVSLAKCGRWWGVSGRRFLPINLITYRMTSGGFYQIRRYMRRLVQSSGQKKRDRGRGARGLACWVQARTLVQLRRMRH